MLTCMSWGCCCCYRCCRCYDIFLILSFAAAALFHLTALQTLCDVIYTSTFFLSFFLPSSLLTFLFLLSFVLSNITLNIFLVFFFLFHHIFPKRMVRQIDMVLFVRKISSFLSSRWTNRMDENVARSRLTIWYSAEMNMNKNMTITSEDKTTAARKSTIHIWYRSDDCKYEYRCVCVCHISIGCE